MMIDLGDGKHVSVHAHSGKVWLSSYNGCGVVNPLDPQDAEEIFLAGYRMARKLRRG